MYPEFADEIIPDAPLFAQQLLPVVSTKETRLEAAATPAHPLADCVLPLLEPPGSVPLKS